MNSPERIGVYGGTFDPVHNTHLEIARAALEQARLDRVLFVVAAAPPHKRGEVFAGPEDRLAMVEAVLEGEPRMESCRLELDRQGPSYTADTLQELHERHPGDRLLLIVGSDSLKDLPRWRHPDRILALADLLVVKRPGTDLKIPAPLAPHCHVLSFVEDPTSSTAIRSLLQEGGPVDSLLPPEALRVIRERGLYRACIEKPAR